MKNYTITVNGNVYDVVVEEGASTGAPVAAPAAPKAAPKAAPAAAPAQAAPVEEETADDTDEEELIAVLTAAVAASLNTSTYNLRIKSYRRTDNKMPAWNKAGVTETINNRF